MPAHRILITGFEGFVGGVLANTITAARSEHDIEAIAFCHPQTDGFADIRDAGLVEQIVEQVRPTAVVHLAAIAAPRDARGDPDLAWAVNLTGTYNLARAVLRHAPDARFIWTGSSEAYGAAFNRQDKPLTEDAAFDPESVYGATKAAADIMLGQMARDGLNTVRFRPFNHTAPGQQAGYVTSDFARQIARIELGLQEPAMRVGNLAPKRDFLDARDVVRAYLSAAISPSAKTGEAYNLSTGAPVAMRSLLEGLLAHASVDVTVEVSDELFAPSKVPVASGSPEKARRDLDWAPSIPLSQTLLDVLNAWRRHETAALDND